MTKLRPPARRLGRLGARVSVATVLVLLPTAWGAGASLRMARHTPTRSPAPACANPASSGAPLTQQLDGAITGCWLVGVHAPGAYSVALSGFRTTYLGGTPVGAPIAVSLSPAGGVPGTVVTIHGRLRTPEPASVAPTIADVCFDGCNGLTDDGVPLHWEHGAALSPPGTVSRFTADVPIPAAPFFVGGHVHGLVSGVYPIGVSCVGSGPAIEGCGLHPAQGSAPFRLRVARPIPCASAGACETLHLSPPSAPAGTFVALRGAAPLNQLIGTPIGYTLSVRATASHPTRAPARLRAGTLDLAPTSFHVLAGEEWSQLSSTRPIRTVASGLSPGPLSLDAARPSLIVSCAPGAVDLVSSASGHVVASISTGAVALLHLPGGLRLWPPPGAGHGAATCASVLADPAHDGTFLAAFPAASAQGAPPVEEVGVVTSDAGRTWRVLPVPPGAPAGSLSGFAARGRSGVAALYGTAGNTDRPVLLEESSGTGATWRPGPVACPRRGPCLRLGAYSPGNCAMNGISQQLLAPVAGHLRLAPLQGAWPGTLDACAPSEVAATSPHSALLVDSENPFLLLSTTDGGEHFANIALPPLRLPQVSAALGEGGAFPPGTAGLVLLPNGSLLATTGSLPALAGRAHDATAPLWHLLVPHARSWCPLAPLPVRGAQRASGTPLSTVVPLDGRLWWSPLRASSFVPTGQLASASLSSLRCR